MSLRAIPITTAGNEYPYVEAMYSSYGDAGGLFVDTEGAVTEDVNPGGNAFHMAEFANIAGNFHGKVFATQNFSSPLAPWWPFSIKHGDDIGIVSPYAELNADHPGYLEIYAYNTTLGMPTGSPTTVHFSPITDSTMSVILSLAKMGTKYYTVHKVYSEGVSATTPQEYAFYGVIHNADGTVDSSWKIEDAISYAPARVPTTGLINLGLAKQNTWTVRIKKSTTAWTALAYKATLGGISGGAVTPSEVTVDGVAYYEATISTWSVDSPGDTMLFRFTLGAITTPWSSAYAWGTDAVLLDSDSTTEVCYVERSDYLTGHGMGSFFYDDDPLVDRVQMEVNTDSDFGGTSLYSFGPEKACYIIAPPFSTSSWSSRLFIEDTYTTASMRARVCDVSGTYTDYSATISVDLDATTDFVTNRFSDFPAADREVAEPSDSDYVKIVLTEWTDKTLQDYNSVAPKLQVRNIANADALFTCLNRTTTTVTSGSSVNTEENILVALESTGATKKDLTDSSFGGFYADATMSGENGVVFITKDSDTQILSYHDAFNDASPTSLGVTAGIAWWWSVMNLKGGLCAIVNILYGGGGIYYKPVTGTGDWTFIADSQHSDMKHMSLDPWGNSFYFGDNENGLILRYVTSAILQSNAVWFQLI